MYEPITYKELQELGFKPQNKTTSYIKDLCNLILQDGGFRYGAHTKIVAEKYQVKFTSISGAIKVSLKNLKNEELKHLKPLDMLMQICIILRNV